MSGTPHAQVLLPVPGRSSECGPEQARSYREKCNADKSGVREMDARTENAMSVSSSQHCSCARQSRHRKTRLGCRPNAGDAEWAERHGCRESAARTWMSVQRGPTERRRSAGSRRRRAKPGAGTLGYLGSFQVTRRRRNSLAVRPNQESSATTNSKHLTSLPARASLKEPTGPAR
jgi:hypothetical protein